MSLLKIARMGHPVLRQVAAPVPDPTDPVIRRLVHDMVETMGDAGGVGLAAPQVHSSLRVIVFQVPDARRNPGEPDGPTGMVALINPVIQPVGTQIDYALEGCLSIPGLRGLVPRHAAIRYTGLAPDGTPMAVAAEGFHARVVQHEVDHLNGVLYLDRMHDLSLLAFDTELSHLVDRVSALAEAVPPAPPVAPDTASPSEG